MSQPIAHAATLATEGSHTSLSVGFFEMAATVQNVICFFRCNGLNVNASRIAQSESSLVILIPRQDKHPLSARYSTAVGHGHLSHVEGTRNILSLINPNDCRLVISIIFVHWLSMNGYFL